MYVFKNNVLIDILLPVFCEKLKQLYLLIARVFFPPNLLFCSLVSQSCFAFLL